MYPTFYVDRDWVSHQEPQHDPMATFITVGFYVIAMIELLIITGVIVTIWR